MENLNKLNKQENRQENRQVDYGATLEHSEFLSTQDSFSREEIAKQKDTSPELLALLAKDEDVGVRHAVAQNLNTSPATLTLLAKMDEEDTHLRKCVAKNPNTPPKALAVLARDKDWDVLECVARNPNIPLKTLASLFEYNIRYNIKIPPDSILPILHQVAKNPDTPPEALTAIARFTKLYLGAVHPLIPSSGETEKDQNASIGMKQSIYFAAVRNPNIPRETLVELASG